MLGNSKVFHELTSLDIEEGLPLDFHNTSKKKLFHIPSDQGLGTGNLRSLGINPHAPVAQKIAEL